MWKWAAAAAILLLFAVLWMTRGSAPARAPQSRQAEPPLPPTPQPVALEEDAPAEAQAPARGVVVDEEGRPIAGATVRLWAGVSEKAPEVRTADDGTFAFAMPIPPEEILVVDAHGYAGRTLPVSDRIVLSRGTLRVVARVVDEDERPVAGAIGEVYLAGTYGRAVSDALGALAIAGLCAYDDAEGGLLVRADDHIPEWVRLDSLRADLDVGTVVLSRGCVVRGVVREQGTGRPVPGAHVWYRSWATWWEDVTTAGTDGSFELRAVPPETNWIYAYADGYLPGLDGWSPDLDDRSILSEGQREMVRDLAVVRSVGVRGIVLDERGSPVANAAVSVSEHETSPRSLLPDLKGGTTTDATGVFLVDGFYAGAPVSIRAATDWGLVRTDARAGERVVLRLDPTRRVVGRVTSVGGARVAKAELTVAPPDSDDMHAFAKSDEDGRFAFDHVRPGVWSLTVEADNLVSLRTTLDVDAGKGEIDLGDVVLGSGSFIAGTVVDEAGAPLEGVRVRAWSREERDGGERHGSAVSDAEGRFRIEGLHGGEFEVRAWSPGPCAATARVASGSAGLVLVMPETASVRGRVLGGEGLLPDADVHSPGAAAGVEADGTFWVSALEPGKPFKLIITHPHYKTLAVEEAEPWKGVRDFRLAEGRFFEGTVVDERGRPLKEMSVSVWTEGNEDGRRVDSGADGRWRAGGLEDGQIMVQLHSDGSFAFEEPVRVAPGIASCQLVARKGYQIHGSVGRKDGRPVEDASVNVHREDGSEVSAGFVWRSRARFSTVHLAPGRYRLVVSGYRKGKRGEIEEHYGEAALEVTVPGPDVEVVLPE